MRADSIRSAGAGRERVYLDHAATSHPKAPGVVDAVARYMTDIGGAPARAGHAESLAASRIVYRTRGALARLLAVDDPTRIVFTASATEALNLAIRGTITRRGARIVTTDMEHNAVWRPLRRVAAELDAQVVVLPTATRTDDEVVDALGRVLADGADLLVSQHGSNVNGRILPVPRMGALAGEADVPFLVDAAQTAGIVDIDVESMGIDLLAFPGHKALRGPQGIAGLYVGRGRDPQPLLVGGTGSRSESDRQPLEMPDRYESGTPNGVGIAGLGAALSWLERQSAGAPIDHETHLIERLEERVRAIPGASPVPVPAGARRTGVLSVRVASVDPSEAAEHMDRFGAVAVRAGLHCAPCAHRALGTFPTGTVRFSVGATTEERDVDRAADALDAALRPSIHVVSTDSSRPLTSTRRVPTNDLRETP